MMTEPPETQPSDAESKPTGLPQPLGPPPGVRVISSRELLQGQREVVIEHQGEYYRLRLTRNDRLVLYK